MATAHFPEVLHARAGLKLDAADDADGLLVPGRELGHYELVAVVSQPGARHTVRHCRFGGQDVVLKVPLPRPAPPPPPPPHR